MNSVRIVAWTVAAAAATAGGLSVGGPDDAPKPSPGEGPAPGAKGPAAERPSTLETALLKIAAEYKTYERVSDRTDWAPTLCRVPSPEGAQRSLSHDDETHGRKLYFLYAKDAASYEKIGWSAMERDPAGKAAPWTNPVGQVVVKESFKPAPVPAGQEPKALPADGPGARMYPAEYAQLDGRWFRTGEPAGLFIMLKLDPATPGSDAGWVYAVTAADGKSLVAHGRIASCVECHERTTRDRLYGPRWSWPRDRTTGEHALPVHREKQDVTPGSP